MVEEDSNSLDLAEDEKDKHLVVERNHQAVDILAGSFVAVVAGSLVVGSFPVGIPAVDRIQLAVAVVRSLVAVAVVGLKT